jgi:hypothetical protein
MEMKTIGSLIFGFGALLLIAPMLRAQELSKYRGFLLGSSLPSVLKLSDQKLADVKTVHARPMLIQEITWWPPSSLGAFSRPDSVEQILFSFSNGSLYKISVTYEHASIEGLTAEDMVKSISAEYGPPANVQSEVDPLLNARYEMPQKSVASWEDSQSFFNLVRSPFTNRFGLVIYSKRLNADAELAIAEAAKLEEQERPGKEADQRKKEADDLEALRLKNQKTFHP